jgi:hypothetical protein
MTPLSNTELRKVVEQEVNAIAAGFNREDMPENMGILIPSLDLQKAVDRIMSLITTQKKAIQSDLVEALEAKLKDNNPPISLLPDGSDPTNYEFRSGYNQGIQDATQIIKTYTGTIKGEKAKITKVGIVKDGTAMYWDFDMEGNNIPAIEYPSGKIAGYTIEELTEIAKGEGSE